MEAPFIESRRRRLINCCKNYIGGISHDNLTNPKQRALLDFHFQK